MKGMGIIMKIIEKENNILLEGVIDFNIGQTLECGQCFHFDKIGDEEYVLVAKNRLLRVKQIQDRVTFYNTSLEEYNNLWSEYFDLDRDYGEIKATLLKEDDILKEPILTKNGVRILNQDFFEMMISFIISQNKQITHIKQIIGEISRLYGEKLGEIDGNEYYNFPDLERLSLVTEEEFRSCKTGFRAPYLVDACKKLKDGIIAEEVLRALDPEEALSKLMEVKGIGEKVGSCILLFGLSKREAFPIDVWVKRIMEDLYFHKVTSKKVIMDFAKEHFKDYGGYAQQYLFYFARDNSKSI